MPEQTVEAVPAPARTMEGLRETGYDFGTAVADIVDNSVAAGATTIDINVLIDTRGEVTLSIADDGDGMDAQQLQQAMTYGSPERADASSLGKFGLGLKTASTAFCRRLSVVSRPDGGTPPTMATWDLDYVASRNQWLLLVTDEPGAESIAPLEEIAHGRSGTVVLWHKVDRLLRSYADPGGAPAQNALGRRREDLRFHLAMTFQRFLDEKDDRARNIRIILNGERLKPWSPFQEEHSELVADERQVVLVEGRKVVCGVRAFILPRQEEFPPLAAREARISPEWQGVYVYRENRLIHGADWLGMYQKDPHFNLLRTEFSFDHRLDDALNLDVRKSQIRLDDHLIEGLRRTLAPPRREAELRYRKGKTRRISKKAKEGAHDASNAAIASKEARVGGPKVTVDNASTGKVTIANQQGTFTKTLHVGPATTPGQVHVEPSSDLVDGVLFEPAIIETHKAVRINTQHPYYHKVYVPNIRETVTVQGLDSLLWALCVAELSATSDSTLDLFEEVRREASYHLRKLVEDLPEPADDDLS